VIRLKIKSFDEFWQEIEKFLLEEEGIDINEFLSAKLNGIRAGPESQKEFLNDLNRVRTRLHDPFFKIPQTLATQGYSPSVVEEACFNAEKRKMINIEEIKEIYFKWKGLLEEKEGGENEKKKKKEGK